jgi:hypothetical protein
MRADKFIRLGEQLRILAAHHQQPFQLCRRDRIHRSHMLLRSERRVYRNQITRQCRIPFLY